MRCFSSSSSSISQNSCAVQRMKTIIDMPCSVFPCLPLVCRWICISRCLLQNLRQTTPGWNICRRQLVVPWLRWPQWCAPPLHHKPFRFASKYFWTCFRVSTPQNQISPAHFLAMNFFRPFAESPAIALLIFIAVFATCTKKHLSCDTDIDATATTASVRILGLINLIHSADLPTAPVFLSPLLSPSLLMSLALVPSCYSSLSYELSDDSDNDDSTLWPAEASSSFFPA